MDSRYPIREIFADSLDWYLREHAPSSEQLAAANAIAKCKTGVIMVLHTHLYSACVGVA